MVFYVWRITRKTRTSLYVFSSPLLLSQKRTPSGARDLQPIYTYHLAVAY